MKKSTKRFVTLIFALSIIFSIIVPAAAIEPDAVQPRMVGISNLSARLAISDSGKATCTASVYNNGDYDVTVIITLTRDGTPIKSWTVPAEVRSNVIEKYYYVTSSHDYQVTVNAEISSNGSLVRSYPISSSIMSY